MSKGTTTSSSPQGTPRKTAAFAEGRPTSSCSTGTSETSAGVVRTVTMRSLARRGRKLDRERPSDAKPKRSIADIPHNRFHPSSTRYSIRVGVELCVSEATNPERTVGLQAGRQRTSGCSRVEQTLLIFTPNNSHVFRMTSQFPCAICDRQKIEPFALTVKERVVQVEHYFCEKHPAEEIARFFSESTVSP